MSTHNQRIVGSRPMVSPALLRDEAPLTDAAEAVVVQSRTAVANVLNRDDDRLLVVVGPCSVHDPAAGLDYARRLAALTAELSDQLCVVMRVYFEKPRTTTGWKGLINDPALNGTGDVGTGLRVARRLLLEVVGRDLPVAVEFLHPIMPQYLADTVAWGAIGARTVESQVHRQLASGLSMPIGMKNRPDGSIATAIGDEFGISQPAVSQHLRVLRDNGFATVTVDGTRRLEDGQRVRVDGSRGLVLHAAPRTTEHAEQPG